MPQAPPSGRRLLFLSTVYPTPWEPHKGPAVRSLVESLRTAGCSVRVIAPVPWTRKSGQRTLVEPVEQYPTYWYPPGLFRSKYHVTMRWSTAATLCRVSREFRPDAVLAFWTDPDGTVAVAHARALGVPSGVIAAGSDLMLLPQDPARRRVISRTLRDAGHVFAVGSVLRQRAIELGAAPERTSIFLAGVDRDAFIPGSRADARARLDLPTDGPLLLWIGNMVPVKGTERLLRAAVALREQFPTLHVALVGGGPERTALERQAAGTPSLRGNVTFAGAVDHAALADWYRAATLFVLPSRSEGVPNVLLEAMAMGLPFVASDVGSIRDLLPFGPSHVVPEGDVEALAAAITTALETSTPAPAPRIHDSRDGARHLMERLGLAGGGS